MQTLQEQNAYKNRWKRIKKGLSVEPIKTKICIYCKIEFNPRNSRQTFCTKLHGDYYRHKSNYRNKYVITLRGKSPESFLNALRDKNARNTTLSKEFLHNLYYKQKGKCALSGIQMTHIMGQGRVNTNISIDRINSKLGYTENNVRLVCVIVNIMKHTSSDNELFYWCLTILNNRNAGKK